MRRLASRVVFAAVAKHGCTGLLSDPVWSIRRCEESSGTLVRSGRARKALRRTAGELTAGRSQCVWSAKPCISDRAVIVIVIEVVVVVVVVVKVIVIVIVIVKVIVIVPRSEAPSSEGGHAGLGTVSRALQAFSRGVAARVVLHARLCSDALEPTRARSLKSRPRAFGWDRTTLRLVDSLLNLRRD